MASADVLPLVGGSRPIFPYELVARILSRAAEFCREFTEAASSARVLVSAGVAAPSGCSAGPRATLEMPAQVRLQRLGQHVQPATAAAAAASARPKWIIDCHTHFWDTRRGEAHSWPARDSPLTVVTPVALPSTLEIVCPAMVTGTVVVEAVYSLEDNWWMLGLSDQQHNQREGAVEASTGPLVVGLVGKLAPGSQNFHRDLESFASHRRFVGIRCGAGELLDAERAGVGVLDALVKHGLELDFAGGCDEIRALLSLLPSARELRVVINHMGMARFTPGAAPSAEWADTMRAAAAFPNVYMKVSAVLSTVGRRPEEVGEGSPVTLEAYAPHLDLLADAFGAERLIYGSDWPVCNGFGDAEEVYAAQLALLLKWAGQKGEGFADGLFWQNALAAYRYDTRALPGPV